MKTESEKYSDDYNKVVGLLKAGERGKAKIVGGEPGNSGTGGNIEISGVTPQENQRLLVNHNDQGRTQ